MKIAVIGGTGLIGSQVVRELRAAGHEAVPHAKSTGVDVLGGQGLDEAPAGADVVVDLTNSPTSDADTVRLPATPVQPIAAADVASAVAEVAAGAPLNGVRDIAGPGVFPLDELDRLTLSRKGDHRTVVTDPTAGMFALVKGDVLTDPNARLAPTRYTDRLA
ncbi:MULTISPECIES: hypothetical protein [unclassified Streptomyces]|uniref:hypothetical protein n=1 Tax=unclassified Streptomyces TaxID=2593676 RepID=UPI00382BB0D7